MEEFWQPCDAAKDANEVTEIEFCKRKLKRVRCVCRVYCTVHNAECIECIKWEMHGMLKEGKLIMTDLSPTDHMPKYCTLNGSGLKRKRKRKLESYYC